MRVTNETAGREGQTSTTANPQPKRQGPRPLALHLTMAGLTWASSQLAWTHLNNGSISWRGPLAKRAVDLAANLEALPPDAFQAALGQELLRRQNRLLKGIQAYRHHPYERLPQTHPVIWEEGTTRLLDYGTEPTRDQDIPVLVVPSLINRCYVLDLKPGCSFLGWLAERGFRPYLVDWGGPGETERSFSLTDYIAGRLENALDCVLARHGQRPLVLGYCMGGLLALALALRREDDLAGLALLATPWDFHKGQAAQTRLAATTMAAFLGPLEHVGVLPVDAIQALFSTIDPLSAVRKFEVFSRLDPESPEAESFVALEDWLNDGVPLAAHVARECLSGWYVENKTARGEWRIAGRIVDPTALSLPSLCVIPAQDRIVPPASASALAALLPHNQNLKPRTGHIGMVVSQRAPKTIWPKVQTWLRETAYAANR